MEAGSTSIAVPASSSRTQFTDPSTSRLKPWSLLEKSELFVEGKHGAGNVPEPQGGYQLANTVQRCNSGGALLMIFTLVLEIVAQKKLS